MLAKLSFVHLVVGILALAFVSGIAVFVLSGATTNKGTTGAISDEYSKIVAAEKVSCHRYGKYASIATLQREGLLSFKPIYNSVVYLPGNGCGSVVVGSAAYEPSAR